MYSSLFTGCGHYLPEKVVTNKDLESTLDTTHEWIFERTGIEQRQISNETETTAYMATKAALRALDHAGLTAKDIDAIIVATTTPDHIFPAVAVRVQHNIGAEKAFGFDIQAACSGFVYALGIADNFIKSGQIKKALVIGADSMSRLVDWTDRSTAILFGDGAGAYILESTPYKEDTGIISTHLFSDGQFYDLLYVGDRIDAPNNRGCIKMDGRNVYKHAIRKMGDVIRLTLEKNKISLSDIDWLIPHQANKRILEAIADHFNLPIEKMIITIGKHSNTSAATIPLATAEAIMKGQIKEGQLLLLEALGGGLTWGSALMRYR